MSNNKYLPSAGRPSLPAGPPRAVAIRRRRIALATVAVAIIALGLALLGGGESRTGPPLVQIAGTEPTQPPASDPLAWEPARAGELEQRAELGVAHTLFALSPGGVLATAERTAAWRDQVEAAASRAGLDPDLLEALVFLESAGRPGVIAGPTPDAASGLAQILPGTATDLLGMRVDLPASARLTRRIDEAGQRGRERQARRLERRRAVVDERFAPAKALAGAARYLALTEERFGREDFAVAAYHMGIGNMTAVIDAYVSPGDTSGPVADVVAANDLSYAEIYFNSSPTVNPNTYALLSGFGDESANYLWKIRAAEQIMRSWREDPDALAEIAELQTAKASAEELYHPEDATEVFASPDDIVAALTDGSLVAIPDDPRSTGFAISPRLGELAGELGQARSLYAALRPGALATLAYVGASVREISGARAPLEVTSATRDSSYQELLAGRNPEATDGYSLHTTGWAFDVRRRYASDAQAQAFQFVLDRLRALAVIDYAVEPKAIHVTVSARGDELIGP